MANKKLQPSTTYAAIVGRILTQHRQRKGLEQGDLAKALGLGQSSWSRIERGDSIINIEQLYAASDILGVPANRILGEADDAARELQNRDVDVTTAKSIKESNGALALIGITALAALIIASKGK